MDQNFFTNLPSEILINIFSRLPIPTITACKSVCKSWLNLVSSDDFINFHLSKSTPGLAVLGCNVFELDDGPNVDRHELHYSPVADFDHTALLIRLNSYPIIQGSVNGLILLRNIESLYVLNPITRDYIELPSLIGVVSTTLTYGFGVSKFSGQYKVVGISCKSICMVYTIGTGSWRSVESKHELDSTWSSGGVFLNGNLHWLVSDSDCRISCFDLETEEFRSFFPARPYSSLSVLRDYLCLIDYSSDDEVAFWLMKEYGVEKSWVKEFVISRFPPPPFEPCEAVHPIKFFKNGDVLMAFEDYFLFYYSVRTKTTHGVSKTLFTNNQVHADAIACVLSFVSLKRFGMENVRSF